jgi:hypothetical protein
MLKMQQSQEKSKGYCLMPQYSITAIVFEASKRHFKGIIIHALGLLYLQVYIHIFV